MFSKEDIILTKIFIYERAYNAKKIITEFLRKNGRIVSINDLLHQFDSTGSVNCDISHLKERLIEALTSVSLTQQSTSDDNDYTAV